MKYLVVVVRSVRMWRVGVVLTAAVPGLLIACAGGDDRAEVRPIADDAGATTTTARSLEESTTTTSTGATAGAGSPTSTAPSAAPSPDPVRAEVEAAYRNAVQAFIDAAAIPDPAFPGLAQWTTGAMFEGWTNDLSAMQIQGRRAQERSPSRRRIEVVAFAPRSSEEVVIETCELDDGVLFEVASGSVVNDLVETSRFQSLMIRVDGRFRLGARESLGARGGEECFAG